MSEPPLSLMACACNHACLLPLPVQIETKFWPTMLANYVLWWARAENQAGGGVGMHLRHLALVLFWPEQQTGESLRTALHAGRSRT